MKNGQSRNRTRNKEQNAEGKGYERIIFITICCDLIQWKAPEYM